MRRTNASRCCRYTRTARVVSPLALLTVLAPGPATGRAERILDQMGIVEELRYTSARGNHSGGALVYGKNYSVELCDDFYTTSTGFIITEVEVGNLIFGVEWPRTAWVSIYEAAADSGPKETALYDVRHEVTTNTAFDDPIFGLAGLKSAIRGLGIALRPNTRYYISVQTESGDWAYTALGYLDSKTAYVRMRDNGRNGYQGGYGHTTWRRSWEPYDAAYRIEAVPEPVAGALLVMAAGAACSLRKRPVGLRPNDAFEK